MTAKASSLFALSARERQVAHLLGRKRVNVRLVRPLLVYLAGIVAIVGLPSCTNCGPVPCPYGGATTALYPEGLPSPLVEVMADPPCSAMLPNGDGGAPVVVQVSGTPSGPATCTVLGLLADGERVATSVSFTPYSGACCSGFTSSGGAFMTVDAAVRD